MCSLLHQRYAEFSPLLVQQLQRALAPPSAAGADRDDERAAWHTRQRPLLRLLAELYLVRVLPDPSALIAALKEAVRSRPFPPSKNTLSQVCIVCCRSSLRVSVWGARAARARKGCGGGAATRGQPGQSSRRRLLWAGAACGPGLCRRRRL
jgi:hypothetical protein